jgi:hypothetical protein
MEALAEATGLIEHRRAPRINVLKRAKVAYDQGFSSVDCLIRNVSDSGAKLRFSPLAMTVPDNFHLVCMGSPVQSCEVVWRRIGELGVRFV